MQKVFKRILSLCLAFAMCLGITAIVNGTTAEFTVADAATDYYAPITATGGNELLGQVHDLITTTHTRYTSYDDCKNPTYVKQTDPGTGGAIMEFYAQANLSSTWQSGAVGTWNREHVWCQSLSNGLWGESGGGSDLHHIRPTESRVNSSRGNNKYGVVTTKTQVWYRDAAGNNVALAGYNSGGVFEPLDNVKGDVARIIMYVYTHYNTYSNVYGTTNGSGGKFGTLKFANIMSAGNEDAAIELLLQWNELDPVDQIEITRNEAVYSIQGNRNPFIDHPEYADAIWGDGELSGGGTTDPSVELKSISVSPATLTLNVGRSEQLTVTANPSNASKSVDWASSNTSVATVSSNGVVTANAEGTATITATSKTNSSIKATAQVTVEKSNLSSITITANSFTLTDGYGFKSWSEGGISGTGYIYGGNSGSMQFNKNRDSYYVASTTATSAPIKSVTVKSSSEGTTDRDWKLLTSTTPYGEVKGKPTNGNNQGTKTVTQQGVTWTVGGSDTYFALTYEFPTEYTSAAAYLESITIEFGESENAHSHSYTSVGYNSEQHWNYCPDDNEIDPQSYENHKYGNGVCTVCGYGHVNHDYANGVCKVCGYAHTDHKFEALHNDTLHWEECSVCHLKQNEYSHNTNGQGKNAEGHWNYCADCGYVVENTREKHSFVYDAETEAELCSQCGYLKDHQHTLEWKSDKTNHWQQCTECDYTENQAEHAWSAWTPDDGETHSRSTVCGVEHQVYIESAAHDYVNGVCAECQHEHENHEWANGTCTVCGAQDPDFTIGEEDTKLQEFHNAVVNIVTNGTLQERLNSINKAIVAYQTLSDEQKTLAEEDIAALREAINDYNQTITSLNEEAEKANNAATNKSGAVRG